MFKKSKVVMLPTQKAIKGQIIQYKEDTKLINDEIVPKGQLGYAAFEINANDRFQPQHIYFLSDEIIKEGDWIYVTKEHFKTRIFKCEPIPFKEEVWVNENKDICKKIIASTDPFLNRKWEEREGEQFAGFVPHLPRPSDSFIKKYCERVGGIDEVMVEYKEHQICFAETQRDRCFRGSCDCRKELILKVAPDNTITIKAVKDSWNREEHINDIKRLIQLYETTYRDGDINKWIEENL